MRILRVEEQRCDKIEIEKLNPNKRRLKLQHEEISSRLWYSRNAAYLPNIYSGHWVETPPSVRFASSLFLG